MLTSSRKRTWLSWPPKTRVFEPWMSFTRVSWLFPPIRMPFTIVPSWLVLSSIKAEPPTISMIQCLRDTRKGRRSEIRIWFWSIAFAPATWARRQKWKGKNLRSRFLSVVCWCISSESGSIRTWTAVLLEPNIPWWRCLTAGCSSFNLSKAISRRSFVTLSRSKIIVK